MPQHRRHAPRPRAPPRHGRVPPPRRDRLGDVRRLERQGRLRRRAGPALHRRPVGRAAGDGPDRHRGLGRRRGPGPGARPRAGVVARRHAAGLHGAGAGLLQAPLGRLRRRRGRQEPAPGVAPLHREAERLPERLRQRPRRVGHAADVDAGRRHRVHPLRRRRRRVRAGGRGGHDGRDGRPGRRRRDAALPHRSEDERGDPVDRLARLLDPPVRGDRRQARQAVRGPQPRDGREHRGRARDPRPRRGTGRRGARLHDGRRRPPRARRRLQGQGARLVGDRPDQARGPLHARRQRDPPARLREGPRQPAAALRPDHAPAEGRRRRRPPRRPGRGPVPRRRPAAQGARHAGDALDVRHPGPGPAGRSTSPASSARRSSATAPTTGCRSCRR